MSQGAAPLGQTEVYASRARIQGSWKNHTLAQPLSLDSTEVVRGRQELAQGLELTEGWGLQGR